MHCRCNSICVSTGNKRTPIEGEKTVVRGGLILICARDRFGTPRPSTLKYGTHSDDLIRETRGFEEVAPWKQHPGTVSAATIHLLVRQSRNNAAKISDNWYLQKLSGDSQYIALWWKRSNKAVLRLVR